MLKTYYELHFRPMLKLRFKLPISSKQFWLDSDPLIELENELNDVIIMTSSSWIHHSVIKETIFEPNFEKRFNNDNLTDIQLAESVKIGLSEPKHGH